MSNQPENHKFPPGYFDEYQSVFSYRYGSAEMRKVWSENHKLEWATRLWTAVARAQSKAGLVSKEEIDDLEAHIGSVSYERLVEHEKTTKHDVVAAIKTYAEQALIGGRIIHLGMTSEDMTSNVDMIRNLESIDIVTRRLDSVLLAFADKIDKHADIACAGWTHLQPAVPTTVGYRLAHHAMNFFDDRTMLLSVRDQLRSKGIKGAVGTSASFKQLLKNSNISPQKMEAMVMEELGLTPALITTQVYPRKHDAWIANALAGIGDSAVEFGAVYRLLQSPVYGEWTEPSSGGQVGSSAMPWKRNPINAENGMSLGRGILGDLINTHTVAQSQILERGLDDSADRRITQPDMFFRTDEVLSRVLKVVTGLKINSVAYTNLLKTWGPFASIERVLNESVEKYGADRQAAHERLRILGVGAFNTVSDGKNNPLSDLVANDEYFLSLGMSRKDIKEMFEDIDQHVGDAPDRCRKFVTQIRQTVQSDQP